MELCPRFKEEVFKKWIAAMKKELNKEKKEDPCGLAHSQDVARTKDDNVARTNISLSSKIIKGVI